MILYCVEDKYQNNFAYITTGLALQNIGRYVGWPTIGVNIRKWQEEKLSLPLNQVKLCVFHAANVKIGKINIRELREDVPNARIVVMGSDTIEYRASSEYYSPADVDLHLDTMDNMAEMYKKRGYNVDTWNWTISQTVIDYIKSHEWPREKKYNGICLIGHLHNEYRRRLQHELGGGFIFGNIGYDYDKIFRKYAQSWLCIGTSSPSWTKERTAKGMRDWLAPFLGTLLVYDDFPCFCRFAGELVDYYEYNNPRQILDLLKEIRSCSNYYDRVEKQRTFAEENTLEKQFLRIFLEKRFIF